ncbi:hypothetical protein [Kibdelosporangium philippinense]
MLVKTRIWPRGETYVFAIGVATGQVLPQVRVQRGDRACRAAFLA